MGSVGALVSSSEFRALADQDARDAAVVQQHRASEVDATFADLMALANQRATEAASLRVEVVSLRAALADVINSGDLHEARAKALRGLTPPRLWGGR